MNTPVLSIIEFILATTLFVLPLAIVCLRTRPLRALDVVLACSVVGLAAMNALLLLIVHDVGANGLGIIAMSVAALAVLVLVFVPATRLAALRLFLVRRTRGDETLIATDVPGPTTTAATDQRPDGPVTRDGPALVVARPPRLGYFVIETVHVERTRLLVEMFLERETKRWRLDGSTGNRSAIGQIPKSAALPSTLLYLVRFRRSSKPETLRDRLKTIGESSAFTVRLECDDDLIARSA